MITPPLTSVEFIDVAPHPGYRVYCTLHGDVTREESAFTAEGGVPIAQAYVYRQRHLAQHLRALATEIEETAR